MIPAEPAQAVFWTAVGLLIYIYLGYPALIALWAAVRPRRCAHGSDEPTISLLIVAHNERDHIHAKIADCLAVDYPRNRLEVIIASDGSTDGTPDVARSFNDPAVRSFAFDRRRGKPAVLNDTIPRLGGELVVLADARQRLESGTLRALVAPFADPRVGAVSGELVLRASGDGQGDGESAGHGVGFYWRYEKFIRRSESAVDSTVGATGALYAIRRRLFRPIPDDTILDDVLIPMSIVRQGYRVVFEAGARVFDRTATARRELARKSRTIAGTFQLFARERWLLNPLANRLWFQAVSHKGLRLLLPLLHLAAFGANLALVRTRLLYDLLMAGQMAFYATAALGPLVRHPLLERLASLPFALCLLTWATVVGFVRFVRGLQPVTWEPTGAPDRAPRRPTA
jgi:cellulose synthase/poly-beta-1,6-N-acetylglucosamine synthase-like glycosyltransferase